MVEQHQSPFEQLRQRLIAMMRYLVEPFTSMADNNAYQQARLIAALVLLQFVVGIVVYLSGHVLYEYQNSALLLYRAYPIILFGLYLISRTRYYKQALYISLAFYYLLIFYFYIVNPVQRPETTFNFLTSLVFITSLTASLRHTIIAAAICLISIVLAGMLVESPYSITAAFIFNLSLDALIITGAFIRHRNVQRLRESEQRYRELMEANFQSIMIQDTEGHILDVNRAFETTFGYTLPEVMGHHPLEYVAPESRDEMLKRWQDRYDRPYELTMLHKDGRRLELEVLFRPHVYRNKPAYVVIGRDITDYKAAQNKRREYEMRYEALFEQSSTAVFITEMDGTLRSVNAQAARMLRTTIDALKGDSIDAYLVPDEESDSEQYRQQLLEGYTVPVYERRMRCVDGSEFIAEISATIVRDGEGNPLYFQNIVRDMTEQRRLQRQELQLTLQKERVKMLEKFIDDISHHFRTPLSNIRTSTYLLNRLKGRPDKQEKHYGVLTSEIARLDNLLNDLLMVTRLEKESSASDVVPSRVKVCTLLNGVIEKIEDDKRYPHIIWQLQCDHEQDLAVFSSRRRLSLAVMHLLDNAGRYTPDGGTVTIHAYRCLEWVIIDVQDHGMGIAEIDLPYIFDYFFRADAAYDIDYTRNGLGLPICKKIVEMYGGLIRVQTSLENGSRFRIVLAHADHPIKLTEKMVSDEVINKVMASSNGTGTSLIADEKQPDESPYIDPLAD